VERKKLSNHPFIIKGIPIAKDQLNSDRYLGSLFGSLKIVSEQDLEQYYEDHPEFSTIKSSKRVCQVVGEVLNPIQYDNKALNDIFQKMEANLHFLIKEAGDLVKQEKAKIPQDKESGCPDLPCDIFEDLLKKYSTDLYKFEFRSAGLVKPEDIGDIWPIFENLMPGDFSPVEKAVPFVYCYYIENFDPGEKKPFSKVQDQIKKHLILSRIGEAAEELKGKIIRETGLQFEQVIQ
jgi:hypothetical protein